MIKLLTVFFLCISNIAYAETSDDLHKAITLAGRAHALVRNKNDAQENSDLLKQIDILITPPLATYSHLKLEERDLLAEAIVLAAQSDSSYSLASEHINILRRYENQFSKSIEKLVLKQALTRDQADLFFNGLELSDTQL